MFNKKNKGFTLVELMVVIVIVGIIATMALPSYYGSIRKARYEESVSEVVAIIKDARNTSIVGKFTGSTGFHTTPKGGFGVYIIKTVTGGSIVSFQDKDEDLQYNPTNDTHLSTYELPDEIIIKTMSGSQSIDYTAPDTNSNLTNAIVLFKPPQGETIINENIANKELIDLYILLERFDGNKSKRLKINKISGFIESD